MRRKMKAKMKTSSEDEHIRKINGHKFQKDGHLFKIYGRLSQNRNHSISL